MRLNTAASGVSCWPSDSIGAAGAELTSNSITNAATLSKLCNGFVCDQIMW